MSEWKNLTKNEILIRVAECEKKYEEIKASGLKLDMSRGKPSPDVLDLSNGLLAGLGSWLTESGDDTRNYGVAIGLPECRRLFSELTGAPADQIICGNNASLELMYNAINRHFVFGTLGHAPWRTLEKVKFLCPCPGYDRHFAITQEFGIEMIVVPMSEDGPDMDVVEKLAAEDEAIKGIWCVPLYSNPQGVVYSDETTARLAKMKTKAADFRVFWDNAYGVHHVFEEHKIANIMKLAEEAGNPERVYYFFSTSKITFPGGGVGMMAAGPQSVREIVSRMDIASIGSEKINQLRFVRHFKNAEGVYAHMRNISKILRPKFEIVVNTLDRELGGTGLAQWLTPKGGYFVAIDTLDGCAKEVVAMAKEAGTALTGAGATFPYGIDPRDRNIRIAPTYTPEDDLQKAIDLLCLCVKISGGKKLLSDAY